MTPDSRPKTILVTGGLGFIGSNILARAIPDRILECSHVMLDKTNDSRLRTNRWQNPFGDGRAGERIVRILVEARSSMLLPNIGYF